MATQRATWLATRAAVACRTLLVEPAPPPAPSQPSGFPNYLKGGLLGHPDEDGDQLFAVCTGVFLEGKRGGGTSGIGGTPSTQGIPLQFWGPQALPSTPSRTFRYTFIRGSPDPKTFLCTRLHARTSLLCKWRKSGGGARDTSRYLRWRQSSIPHAGSGPGHHTGGPSPNPCTSTWCPGHTRSEQRPR